VYAVDPKLLARLAPKIRRVLILDGQPASARVLGELMRALGSSEVVVQHDDQIALEVARDFAPDLVFVESAGPRIDGAGFTGRLRRSHLACRKVPVIVVASEATAASIKAARDAGVHEFLKKPFNATDLLKRVEAVALKPRDWVEAVGYVGPDRRRFNSGDYDGPLKRESDHPKTEGESRARRLDQAFRILKSALLQFDSDPPQAIRAMREQAREMGELSVELGMPKLAQAAALLEAALKHPSADKATLRPAVAGIVALFEPNTPVEATQTAAAA
jgi:CheY-like chemotaxis protein